MKVSRVQKKKKDMTHLTIMQCKLLHVCCSHEGGSEVQTIHHCASAADRVHGVQGFHTIWD